VKIISSKTDKKKISRKVKGVKTSRLAEVMKILNAGNDDLFAEEMLRSQKGALRKKTSNTKRAARG
jgi:hypothetical protein